MVTTFSTAYAALIVGVAEAMERITAELVQRDLGAGGRVPDEVLESWTAYWATCLIFGVIGAILYYAIGGWWFRVRLKLSGDAEPDPRLARQVYIYASLIIGLPTVVLTVIDSIHYPTPLAAERGAQWWWIASALLPFWSVYASYRGVRTLFDAVRWKAVIWFFVLPSLFFLLVYAFGLLLAVLAGLGVVNIPPDVSHPSTIDRHAFSLRYPGNWWVDEGDEDYDPDAYFSIEPMQDALVTFVFPDYPIDPEEATAVHLESCSPNGGRTPESARSTPATIPEAATRCASFRQVHGREASWSSSSPRRPSKPRSNRASRRFVERCA
jgi:hypothetical protein